MTVGPTSSQDTCKGGYFTQVGSVIRVPNRPSGVTVTLPLSTRHDKSSSFVTTETGGPGPPGVGRSGLPTEGCDPDLSRGCDTTRVGPTGEEGPLFLPSALCPVGPQPPPPVRPRPAFVRGRDHLHRREGRATAWAESRR